MSDRRMVMVFSYDIQDDRVRRRVSELLEQRAVRVQKSVFEARLTRRRAALLFERLAGMIEEGDSLRMYALPRSAVARSRAHGGAPLPEDAPFHLV